MLHVCQICDGDHMWMKCGFLHCIGEVVEEAEDGIESNGATPKSVLQQVSDKGRTFSYLPSPFALGPSGIGPTVK